MLIIGHNRHYYAYYYACYYAYDYASYMIIECIVWCLYDFYMVCMICVWFLYDLCMTFVWLCMIVYYYAHCYAYCRTPIVMLIIMPIIIWLLYGFAWFVYDFCMVLYDSCMISVWFLYDFCMVFVWLCMIMPIIMPIHLACCLKLREMTRRRPLQVDGCWALRPFRRPQELDEARDQRSPAASWGACAQAACL